MTTNKQSSTPSNGVQTTQGIAPNGTHPVPMGDLPENPLSEREMEVARLLVTGATNGEIARHLVISPHTVKVHLRNVFDKLQVSSRTEASMLLVQRGWVLVPGVEVATTDTNVVDTVVAEETPAIPEPEPLANLEAQPRPWQLGIVTMALAVALVALLLPTWITTPKSPMGLLTDSGQTLMGKPVLNNLPDRWKVQTPLSQPRSRMAALQIAGEIYVVGGEDENGAALDLVEIYNPDLGQWRQGAPMPAARANLAMTLSGDDLLVAGGSRIDDEIPTEIRIYDDMARYDRLDDRWTEGGKLPMSLAGAALAAHGESLYLLGGWNGEAMQDAVWRLPIDLFQSASAGDWEVVSHLPKAVGWFGAVLVNDEIFIAGGYDGRRELADFATLNVTTGEWQPLAALTTPRSGMSLVYDGITVLALGGGWAGTVQNHERYDMGTNQWTIITSPISGEWRHFGAVANDGSVYILGGWSGAYLDMHVQFQSTFRALLPIIPNE